MTTAAFVLPLLLLTAQDKKPAATSTPGLALPPGAVKIDDITYKVKEKDGKTYVYRRNPFGVSRLPEEQFQKIQSTPNIAPSTDVPVKVTDLGAEYRFQRMTPFGGQSWKRAKSDLTAEERAYVEKSLKEQSSAASPAAAPEKKN